MARRVSTARGNHLSAVELRDFTGGLSLVPPQELGMNESAMARNVVFSARGGVHTRPGHRPFSASPIDTVTTKTQIMRHTHLREDGVRQLFGVDTNGDLYWSSGGAWFDTDLTVGSLTAISTEDSTLISCNAAQYLGNSYFVQVYNDFNQMWNGYVMTPLGLSFDEDLAAPSGLNMPDGRIIAVKGDFVFVAAINEVTGDDAGTYQASRIRWSHPGIPTSWRSADFADIPEGHIRALVPFRDYLAIFTDDAIYGLYGESTETFQIQSITTSSGTPAHTSVTTSPNFMYWWDWDQGVMRMGSGAPVSVFDQMKPFFDQGGFDATSGDLAFPPNVLWGQGKLYVNTGQYNQRAKHASELGQLLVFDPDVGNGAWTSFDGGGNEGSTVYQRPTETDLVIFGQSFGMELIVNDPLQVLDRNFAYDATDFKAPAVVWRSAPIAGDTNVTRKRYRRPRMTLRSGSSKQRIKFAYRRNYSEQAAADFHDIDLDGLSLLDTASLIWSAGGGFNETFTSENTDRWTGFSGTVHVVTNVLNMDVSTVSGSQTLTTVNGFDMRGAEFIVNLQQVVSTSLIQVFVFDGNEYIGFNLWSGTDLRASWRDAVGVITDVASTTYDASHDWLRVHIDTTTTTWYTSADGVAWTELGSTATPFGEATLDSMKLQLRANQTSSGSGTVLWDNVSLLTGVDEINDTEWDTNEWASDLNGNDPPDDFVFFRTLPSGGAGHAFQFEFRSISSGLNEISTNDTWGIDSIVLPYREKGIR